MNDWTSGYVADIGYTFGYYTELNPLRTRLAFLNAGLVPPDSGTHCELGFGQGISVNVHAAASGDAWHATDFNPSQAAYARELAAVSGAGAQLYDDAFADFCRRPDLPEFDSIGLHGIWSWISDENRTIIVDFIRRKLKVGGVLYISYNTQPGWAAFAPMRHLMTRHAEVIGVEGHGIVSRVSGAIDFAEKLLATKPLYARANPQVAERLANIKGQNRDYLAHEYFNRDWLPMHFATMADWLGPAKLNYACSANHLDHIDPINLNPEQQDFLKEIPDAMLRESVRDFIVNQQFRKDYWVKGSRKLSLLDQAEKLRQQRVLLITPRADVPTKVAGAAGEAVLNADVYVPILDLLADHKVRSLGEIEQALAGKGINFAQVIQAVILLSGINHLAGVQDDAVIARARQNTDRLNAYLMDRARGSSDVNYLASPVTGGAFTIARIDQLFLLARSQGKAGPADWARAVCQTLFSLGQKLMKEGVPIDSDEETQAELTRQATDFSVKQLPILLALQIA